VRQFAIDLRWLPWYIFYPPSCPQPCCADRTMTACGNLWLCRATSSLWDLLLWCLHPYQSSPASPNCSISWRDWSSLHWILFYSFFYQHFLCVDLIFDLISYFCSPRYFHHSTTWPQFKSCHLVYFVLSFCPGFTHIGCDWKYQRLHKTLFCGYSNISIIIIITTKHLYSATKCRHKLSSARLSATVKLGTKQVCLQHTLETQQKDWDIM